MAQVSTLISVVKKQLKAQGKTYLDVANTLQLSEASVKRLFAEENFTLQRMEAIAELLGLELSELMQLVAKQQQQLSELTFDQEQEIAEDLLLLLVTVCVMNNYNFEEIVDDYKISETECIQKLARLDKLKLIELLPNNRIKLLIAPNFKWQKNGPIQKFFQRRIQRDFFRSQFDKETEKLSVVNGMLSVNSIKKLQSRMQKLADDFNHLIKEDAEYTPSEKIGITLVMAERQWEFSIFDRYNKDKDEQEK
jgi:transcriptional regulator with XRE-family HTH domain